MNLVDSLLQVLPEFHKSRLRESRLLKYNGVEGKLSRQSEGRIDAGFSLANFLYGVVFSNPSTRMGFRIILAKGNYSLFVLDKTDFSYEASIMPGHLAFVTPKFFLVPEIALPDRAALAKELVDFYRIYQDPEFEDKF